MALGPGVGRPPGQAAGSRVPHHHRPAGACVHGGEHRGQLVDQRRLTQAPLAVIVSDFSYDEPGAFVEVKVKMFDDIPSPASHYVRVAIVEDDAAMRELLAAALQKKGYEAVEFPNVYRFVHAMETRLISDIDLIISDIRLPGH